MRSTIITLIAVLLVGCAMTASLLQSTPNVVQVEHLDQRFGISEAMKIARAECSKHGRVAVLDKQTCPAQCITQFRCE